MAMTDAHEAAMLGIATALFDAVTAGDIEAVRAIYAPGAVVWHNTDGVAQSVDENLRVLRWIATNITGFRYEQARCEATATGFVEQHITCGTSPSGKPISVPACVIGTVVDGRITRIDEYLDSAQAAQFSS